MPTQQPNWQQSMREAVTDPAELLAMLGLSTTDVNGFTPARAEFRLRVPRGYIARMRHGDPSDPLLRQVLPLAVEREAPADASADPLAELTLPGPAGLLNKYRGRALLITTGACGIHCRYCFRREFPYSDQLASRGGWGESLDHVRADASLREVILSGGDPLTLADTALLDLVERLNAIDHVDTLRIHTRQPIVLPERITDDLLDTLGRWRGRLVIVVHANHANEVDAAVATALSRLHETGATLLNQAVLLAGVNDDSNALAELSRVLFSARVLPYYLHQLDRVRGATHFEVPIDRARLVIRELNAMLPGYLVPRWVQEIPGDDGKTPLSWN